MTLLHMDGFDLGENQIRTDYTYGNAANWGTSTGTAFTYGRCVASSANDSLLKSIPAATKVISGVRIYAGYSASLQFYGDSGVTQHIAVALTNLGALTAVRGGTTIGSYTISPAARWVYIEVAVTISDTVGTVEVRLDGSSTPVISFTGDTKNAGTATTIDQVRLGSVSNIANSFDDWYICNDQGSVNNNFLGDVRVYTLAPNGNGNYSQFVGSDADSTNNYQLVDEQPYSTTDYVSSATSGDRDSYALTDLPANAVTVFAVQEVAVVTKSDAGAQTIKQMIRVNSTDYETSAYTLATSYTAISNLREQNPNTSAAWTPSGVNGIEAGVRVG